MFRATGEAIGSLPVAEAKARLNAGPAATGGRKGGETGEGASLANSLDDNRRNQMKGYNEDQGKQRAKLPRDALFAADAAHGEVQSPGFVPAGTGEQLFAAAAGDAAGDRTDDQVGACAAVRAGWLRRSHARSVADRLPRLRTALWVRVVGEDASNQIQRCPA
jgi:hypothetical protein